MLVVSVVLSVSVAVGGAGSSCFSFGVFGAVLGAVLAAEVGLLAIDLLPNRPPFFGM